MMIDLLFIRMRISSILLAVPIILLFVFCFVKLLAIYITIRTASIRHTFVQGFPLTLPVVSPPLPGH